jgi:predicted transcriptional regulator of viral defense system
MGKEQSKLQQLRTFVQHVCVLHARDLTRMGIPQRYLGLLREEGMLVRIARGVYTTTNDWDSPHFDLAQAEKAVPEGVVCLLSALRFHEIGTQLPHRIWLALDRRAAKPRVSFPTIHLVRFSGQALDEGIEEHVVSGVTVRMYCPAKTVADCFKYRNKIGLDVALEALRDALRIRKVTADSLWKYAKICRVANVMRPYMEAML